MSDNDALLIIKRQLEMSPNRVTIGVARMQSADGAGAVNPFLFSMSPRVVELMLNKRKHEDNTFIRAATLRALASQHHAHTHHHSSPPHNQAPEVERPRAQTITSRPPRPAAPSTANTVVATADTPRRHTLDPRMKPSVSRSRVQAVSSDV